MEKQKVFLVSLGCDKNLVDSEKMLGLLDEAGYGFTDEEEDADAVIVNTCCFIGDAKEESIDALLRYGEMRSKGKLKALIAAGCLSQRYQKELRKEIPEVDACIGTMAIGDIVVALDTVLGKGKDDAVNAVPGKADAVNAVPGKADAGDHFRPLYEPLLDAPLAGGRRILTTGGHYAYLKIAEGCNKCCTYCIIPKVRGPYRSVPMEKLLEEAGTLAEGGVRELILVAQETTIYGIDLYGKKALAELLRKLSEIEGIRWLRVLYAYPEEIDEELIREMKENPKVLHYLDLPIQHADDEILRRMGRRTNQQQLRELIGKLRREIPDICLRTTLISGFPGETQEQFEELYRFVNEMEFDRLGVFCYSREEDTVAAEMPDQVPEEVSESRRSELMELQQAICFDLGETRVGQRLEVMVEGRVADPEENAWEDGDTYVARTYRDAPGVDGYLFFPSVAERMTGDFLTVRVTQAREYDLLGIPEEDEDE